MGRAVHDLIARHRVFRDIRKHLEAEFGPYYPNIQKGSVLGALNAEALNQHMDARHQLHFGEHIGEDA